MWFFLHNELSIKDNDNYAWCIKNNFQETMNPIWQNFKLYLHAEVKNAGYAFELIKLCEWFKVLNQIFGGSRSYGHTDKFINNASDNRIAEYCRNFRQNCAIEQGKTFCYLMKDPKPWFLLFYTECELLPLSMESPIESNILLDCFPSFFKNAILILVHNIWKKYLIDIR